MGVAIRRADKSVIVYDPREIENPNDGHFQPATWAQYGLLKPTIGGRGASWFIQRKPEPDWVLRHYLRGGLPGRLIRDRYLWLGESLARPFAEWRLLFEMFHELELPVPRPVAARVERAGLWYRGGIITERMEGVALAEALAQDGLDPELWQAVGHCLARFHRVGIAHADLNAHNILIAADGHVSLLDFDRGRRRSPGPWRWWNIRRLARSLEKILGPRWAEIRTAGWQQLLEAYEARL